MGILENKALLYHAVFTLSILWPAIVICRRAGVRPIWALTLIVPVFGMVMFSTALAFLPWGRTASRVTA